LIFSMMMRSLWREIRMRVASGNRNEILALAILQAYLVGLGATMLFGTSVIVVLKVSVLIWCFIGALLAVVARGNQETTAHSTRPLSPRLVRDF
jgi:hypothetical protein